MHDTDVLPSSAAAMQSSCGATAATAQTEYVEVDGQPIAYRSFGCGRSILLINRLRGTLDTWDPLFLDTLAATCNVITVDYPGIGYSSGAFPANMKEASDFVGSFAEALDLERFVLLGWSWGGLVAQAVMIDRPERVTHLVLIGTAPPGKGQMPVEQAFLERAFKPVNDLADEAVLFFEPDSPTSMRTAKQSHDRIYARPGVTERIPSTEREIKAYLSVAAEFREDEAGRRQRLLETDKPVLVITGDNDPSARAENWLALVNKTRSVSTVVLPETGHAPQHQHPALTVAMVETFLHYAAG